MGNLAFLNCVCRSISWSEDICHLVHWLAAYARRVFNTARVWVGVEWQQGRTPSLHAFLKRPILPSLSYCIQNILQSLVHAYMHSTNVCCVPVWVRSYAWSWATGRGKTDMVSVSGAYIKLWWCRMKEHTDGCKNAAMRKTQRKVVWCSEWGWGGGGLPVQRSGEILIEAELWRIGRKAERNRGGDQLVQKPRGRRWHGDSYWNRARVVEHVVSTSRSVDGFLLREEREIKTGSSCKGDGGGMVGEAEEESEGKSASKTRKRLWGWRPQSSHRIMAEAGTEKQDGSPEWR